MEKLNAEFHIVQSGGHGFGVEHPTKGNKWIEWCVDWLIENGFVVRNKDKRKHLQRM